MRNVCETELCDAEPLTLCEGHLRHFVLMTLADLFDQAAVDLNRELEADEEDE